MALWSGSSATIYEFIHGSPPRFLNALYSKSDSCVGTSKVRRRLRHAIGLSTSQNIPGAGTGELDTFSAVNGTSQPRPLRAQDPG